MHYKNKVIGLLGGAFDPIHHGHLRLALELYQSLDLAEVRLIPCYQPVHRKTPDAPPEQRLAMVKCATAAESALVADDREIRRQTPSYTIDTLLELRAEMPDQPFCLLLGIDAFLGFTSWHRWQEILTLAHLVVAHRPQYHLPATGLIADLVRERLCNDPSLIHDQTAGRIFLRPITPLEISATEIRKLIAKGRNPRYLLPDSVLDYIQTHGIYSLSRIGS